MTPELWISIVGVVISAIVAFVTVSLRMGEYKNKVDNLEITVGKDEHAGLRKTVTDMKTELDKLSEFKVNAQKFIDKKLYETNSPLKLTEFGQQLVDESGFSAIFPNVRDDLVRLLEIKQPKTRYDVQETARALMDELTDYPAFQSLKTYAFEHGKDYPQILRAGAIPLRDYYLSIHQDIPADPEND